MQKHAKIIKNPRFWAESPPKRPIYPRLRPEWRLSTLTTLLVRVPIFAVPDTRSLDMSSSLAWKESLIQVRSMTKVPVDTQSSTKKKLKK